MVPAEAKRCRHCGRAMEGAAPPRRRGRREQSGWRKVSGRWMRPHVVNDGSSLRVEPLPPALGQEPFGSWANIKMILRYDPVFGAVLVLLALNVVLLLLTQRWFGMVLAAAMVWGLVTFRSWGYWLAIAGVGMNLVLGLLMLAGGTSSALSLIPLAINGFVLVVLFTRRDRFD
jgi:hypothetical protein